MFALFKLVLFLLVFFGPTLVVLLVLVLVLFLFLVLVLFLKRVKGNKMRRSLLEFFFPEFSLLFSCLPAESGTQRELKDRQNFSTQDVNEHG